MTTNTDYMAYERKAKWEGRRSRCEELWRKEVGKEIELKMEIKSSRLQTSTKSHIIIQELLCVPVVMHETAWVFAGQQTCILEQHYYYYGLGRQIYLGILYSF